jgi:hypothetical protein
MMKKITYLIFLYLLLSSSLVFAGVSSAAAYGSSNKVLAGKAQTMGKLIIASRASGVISDIDTPSDRLTGRQQSAGAHLHRLHARKQACLYWRSGQ